MGAEVLEEDGEQFDEKMRRLTAQWREQQAEARRLSERGEEKKMSFKEFLMSAPEGLEMIIPERPQDDCPREVNVGFEEQEA